jgi:hypothetical protein
VKPFRPKFTEKTTYFKFVVKAAKYLKIQDYLR